MRSANFIYLLLPLLATACIKYGTEYHVDEGENDQISFFKFWVGFNDNGAKTCDATYESRGPPTPY
jgi:hypothetical protein